MVLSPPTSLSVIVAPTEEHDRERRGDRERAVEVQCARPRGHGSNAKADTLGRRWTQPGTNPSSGTQFPADANDGAHLLHTMPHTLSGRLLDHRVHNV